MADGFIDALGGGNAPLMAFMFRLEKLDKTGLGEFLEAARTKVVSAIRASGQGGSQPCRETLARAESVLQKAGEMLDFNVGSGYISGMICANLIEIEV